MDDPGWRFTWRTLLGVVVPGVAIGQARRSAGQPPLVLIRGLFVSFCTALVMIGLVVLILGDLTDGDVRTAPSLVVVCAVGVLSVAGQRFLVDRLDCTSEATLLASYRTRLFVRLAVAEVPALVAFAMDIVFGPVWIYFVGMAFAFVGFAMLAPTRAHLAQDDDRLSLAGCRLSLSDVLMRGRGA